MKKIAAGLLALAIVFGAAADGVFLDSSAIAASAAAYTEDELKAKVQEGAEYELTDWLYNDFDGDGKSEGFAMFNEYVDSVKGYNSVLKFISSDGEVTEFYRNTSRYAPNNFTNFVCGGKSFAGVFFGGAGTSSDVPYTVIDGKPVEVKIGLTPDLDTDIYETHLSNEDGGLYAKFYARGSYGDEYGPVELAYDAENVQFVAKDSSSSEYTEEELKAKLEDSSDYELLEWVYDDFDGDGKKEGFGVFFGGAEALRETRYIDSEGKVSLMKLGAAKVTALDVGNGKKVAYVSYIHQGYLHFAVYGVKGGEAYELAISSEKNYYGEIKQDDGKFYYINYDERGTETENYEIVYDEESGEFVKAGSEPTPTPDPVTTDYTYTENEDGTVTITSYTGQAEELVIPDKIDGKTVSAIGSGIFSPLNGGNKTIKKITVPGSVKTIGEEAFACADALEEVYIEDGVTEIGNAAFASCINLKKITIPKSVTKIGDYAFSYAYRSDSSAFIDVTIYCYKDSTAHKYALGENALNHVFSYVLLDEVSNPDPSSDSTVSADPSSAESGSSSGSTSTSTSSAAASSSGDKTSNPATGVAAGVSIAAVLAGGIIMVTKKTKK